MSTAFVSGFTSYIALHIVQQLLAKGYTVIGTVRSQAKGEQYSKYINDPKFSFVVVEQIAAEDAFDEALKAHPEVEYIYHVASPLIFNPQDPEKDVLIPAVNGTINMLKAAQLYGKNVKKVIVTSSYSSHNSPFDHYGKNGRVVREDMVSAITHEQAISNAAFTYWGSKAFSFKSAWEYVEKNKPHYGLNTLSPVWCFGPQAYDEVAKESVPSTINIISSILRQQKEAIEESSVGGAIDVRDIARGQIIAAEDPKIVNQKLLLGYCKFNCDLFESILSERFPELGLPKIQKPDQSEIDCPTVDCSKTLGLLQIDLIPIEKSVIETAEQMLRVNKY